MTDERTKKTENKREEEQGMDTGYSWIILLGEL